MTFTLEDMKAYRRSRIVVAAWFAVCVLAVTSLMIWQVVKWVNTNFPPQELKDEQVEQNLRLSRLEAVVVEQLEAKLPELPKNDG